MGGGMWASLRMIRLMGVVLSFFQMGPNSKARLRITSDKEKVSRGGGTERSKLLITGMG
jgi:hypothetical protein